jgi:hypothetical protein
MNKDVSSRLAHVQQLTAEIDRLIEVYTTPDFTMLDVATILYSYLGMRLRMMDDPDGLVNKMKKLMGDAFDGPEAEADKSDLN